MSVISCCLVLHSHVEAVHMAPHPRPVSPNCQAFFFWFAHPVTAIYRRCGCCACDHDWCHLNANTCKWSSRMSADDIIQSKNSSSIPNCGMLLEMLYVGWSSLSSPFMVGCWDDLHWIYHSQYQAPKKLIRSAYLYLRAILFFLRRAGLVYDSLLSTYWLLNGRALD